VDSVLNVDPPLALIIVGLLVFAEDALFVGFVVPGETAAVLGGVVASRGVLPLWSVMVVVVLAAIIGDSAGYEVGKHLGPRLLGLKVMNRRLARLETAQDFLRLRGGSAVFLGRFVAFSAPSCHRQRPAYRQRPAQCRRRGRRRPVRRQAGTMTEAPGRECYRGHATGDTAPAQEWLGWFLADEVPSRITSP